MLTNHDDIGSPPTASNHEPTRLYSPNKYVMQILDFGFKKVPYEKGLSNFG